MRQHRLVTRFLPVKKTAVSTLKRLNECAQIGHQSSVWRIYVTLNKAPFLPEGTQDILTDLIFDRLPPQKLVIFESDTESYAAICQASFIPQLEKVAAINDIEKTLKFVKQLAPKGNYS